MPSYRAARTSEDVMRELTAILREMKDPRIAEAMLSIVKIDLSSDLSSCQDFVSSMTVSYTHLPYEYKRGGVPCGIAARFKGIADSARRKGRGVRLSLNQRPRVKVKDCGAVPCRAEETFTLSDRCVGHRPVSYTHLWR